jgi:hypothetical protein
VAFTTVISGGGGGSTVPGGANGDVQVNSGGSFGGVTLLPLAHGGTGTATPATVAGANIAVSGTFPNQTVALNGVVPIANGGTGTATPSGVIAGTNVTVSGTFPNQTVNASGTGGATTSILARDPTATDATPTYITTTTPGGTGTSYWEALGKVWYIQENTTAAAKWSLVNTTGIEYPANILPNNWTITGTGASGYTIGDTVTFSNGVVGVVTVAGATPTVTSQTSCWANPAGITQTATSGGGTGATWTAVYSGIVASYGTRRVSGCSNGNLFDAQSNVAPGAATPATANTTTFVATANGLPDIKQYGTVCGFGLNCSVSKLYDQTGGFGDATQTTFAAMPFLGPASTVGNAPALMFAIQDTRANQVPAAGQVAFNTATGAILNLPTVSFVGNNWTVVIVGRQILTQAAQQSNWISFTGGNQSPVTVASTTSTFGGKQGGSFYQTAEGPMASPAVIGMDVSGNTFTFMNDVAMTPSGSALNTTPITGGTIGGFNDEIVGVFHFNYALTNAQLGTLQAALYKAYDIQPQVLDRLLMIGDSRTSGVGSNNDQNLCRRVENFLTKPMRISCDALAGWRSDQPGTTGFSSIPSARATNNLAAIWIGVNDINVGVTPATAYANITSMVTALHATTPAFKVVCSTDIYETSFTGTKKTNMDALNALITANTAGCDAIADLKADPIIGASAGMTIPTFSADGIHPNNATYDIPAKIIATAVNTLIQ